MSLQALTTSIAISIPAMKSPTEKPNVGTTIVARRGIHGLVMTINVVGKWHCTTDYGIRLHVLRGSLFTSIQVIRSAMIVNDNRIDEKAKIASEGIKGRV